MLPGRKILYKFKRSESNDLTFWNLKEIMQYSQFGLLNFQSKQNDL